jgi:hypothetical protein
MSTGKTGVRNWKVVAGGVSWPVRGKFKGEMRVWRWVGGHRDAQSAYRLFTYLKTLPGPLTLELWRGPLRVLAWKRPSPPG